MAALRPITVFIFHPTHAFGGAEQTCLNLLKGINKEVFKITLITSRQIASRFSETGIDKIIYIDDIGLGVWFGSAGELWRDIKIAARVLRDECPDIAFGMMHYSSTVLALAKKIFRLKSKVISSPRGPSTTYLETCFSKKSERAYLRFLFSCFCKYSDGIIVPSEGTKIDCIENFGAKAKKVRAINNSIDFNEITLKYREDIDIIMPEDFFVIAAAGRLSPEKNMPLLLQALSILKKQGEKIKLLIVGEGGEREKLENLSKSLGIHDDVVFAGFQSNPFKFLKKADIFVHTCMVEGFGNVIIEAMACGLPVVATDCPYGPREIIEHGRNGLLVPLYDVDALADSINSLLADESARQIMSEAAVKRANDFSVEKMVGAYEDFLKFIIDKLI